MTTTEQPLIGYRFADTARDMPTVYASELIARFTNDPYAFGIATMARTGSYQLMGWSFRVPGLRRFVYRDSHGYLQELYAPNKTILRKNCVGRIQIIAETTPENT